MIVMTLDVRATHVNNPDCPMRIAPHLDGRGWYCVDCGFDILHKRVEVSEGRNLVREMLADKTPNPLGYTADDYSGPPDTDDIARRMGGKPKQVHGRPPVRVGIDVHEGGTRE